MADVLHKLFPAGADGVRNMRGLVLLYCFQKAGIANHVWSLAEIGKPPPENRYCKSPATIHIPGVLTTQPDQMDLAYSIEKPDWVALKILTEEIQDEISQNRHNLLYCLSNWFMALTIFKRFEERQMVMTNPSERDKNHHRTLLTAILANGEKLLQELARHQEIDTKNVGIELVDVQSAVEELRLSYYEWFGDMKPERKRSILGGVFGVEK